MKKRFYTAFLASMLAVSSFVPAQATLLMAEEVTAKEAESDTPIYSHPETVTVSGGNGALVLNEAERAAFTTLSNVTFEANVTVTGTGVNTLLFIGDSSEAAHYANIYVLGNKLGIECLDKKGTSNRTVYSTSVALPNVDWTKEHLVAVSFEGSSKVVFYVDGQKVHEASMSTSFVNGVLTDVDYVGFGMGSRANNGNNYPMTGTISDIRIFSTARTAEQIKNDQFGNLANSLLTTGSVKNGADKTGTITDTASIEKIKDLTEGSWNVRFRLNDSAPNLNYLAALSDNTVKNDFIALYAKKNGAKWRLGVDAPDKNIGGYTDLADNVDLKDGHWHDFGAVREGTKWTFYLDGEKAGEATSTEAGMFNKITNPKAIGIGFADRLEETFENPTNGSIAGVTVYGAKLNSGEMKLASSTIADSGVEVTDLSNAYLSDKNTLFEVGYDNSAAYRIPSMITTTDGTVLVGIDKRQDGFADQGNIDFVVKRKEAGSEDFSEPIVVCDMLDGGAGKKSAVMIDSILLQDTNANSTHKGRIHAFVDMFTQSNAAMELGNQALGDEYLHIGDEAYRKVYKDNEAQPYAVVEEDGVGVVYTTVTENGTTTLGTKTDYTVVLHAPAPYTQMGNLYKSGEYKGNIFLNEECADKGELHMKKVMSIWHFYSDDDGKTWSEPTNITPQIKKDWMRFCGTGPGRGVQLENGRLVMPIYTTNASGLSLQTSAIVTSDDFGETWQLKDFPCRLLGIDPETDSSGTLTTECQPVALRNGDLLLFMRTNSGKVKYAVSKDNGDSWSEIVTTDIPAVYCQYSAISYVDKDDKEYVIVAAPSGPNRENGRITRGLVNADGSITWEMDTQKLFEPTGYAYSCLTEIAPAEDGTKRFANFYELNNDPISMEYVEFDENYLKAENTAIENTAPVFENLEAEQVDGKLRVTATMNQRVFQAGPVSLNVKLNDQTLEVPMVSGSGESTVVFETAMPENSLGVIKATGLNTTNGSLTSRNGVAAENVAAQDLLDLTVIYPTSVISYTSQYSDSTAENTDGAAVNIIDGNPKTYWHSHYTQSLVMPQTITFDFGKEVTIDQFNLLNRQNNTNALIKEYRLEGSTDNTNWTTLSDSELTATQKWQSVPFNKATVRYVRFSVDSVHSGSKWAAIAELSFNLAAEGVARSADKTDLQSVYDDVSKKTADAYTTTSWTAFRTALAHAKAILDDPNAWQMQVDAEANTLRDAAREVADKTELVKDLSEYEKLNAEDYDTTKWTAFQTALTDVKENYETYPTQRAVTNAIMRLNYLASALEEAAPVITSAVITGAASVNAGATLELTVTPSPADVAITSATWTAVDASNQPIEGVTIAESEDNPAKAVLTVADSVADGTAITVKVSAINGTDVAAEKAVTVHAQSHTETGPEELSPNTFNVALPETAQLTEVDGKTVMSGYMSLTDPDLTVTNYLTSGGSFTTSMRIYLPASVNSTEGSLETGEKMNMLLSIGDNSFATRFNCNGTQTIMQSWTKPESEGWKTINSSAIASSQFDKWHEVSTVYDAEAKTLEVFMDSASIGKLTDVNKPSASTIALEIGYMNSHISTRKSDVKFSNVKIIKDALSSAELAALAAGNSTVTDEDVLLWIEYPGLGDSRTQLNSAISAADAYNEADYTADSWAAFKDARDAAKAMNAKYATADNLNDARTALAAAQAALVPAGEAQIDTSVLAEVCRKAGTLDLASFSDTGKDAFSTAKAAADTELAAPVTQASVDAKAAALNQAMLALRLKANSALLDSLQ